MGLSLLRQRICTRPGKTSNFPPCNLYHDMCTASASYLHYFTASYWVHLSGVVKIHGLNRAQRWDGWLDRDERQRSGAKTPRRVTMRTSLSCFTLRGRTKGARSADSFGGKNSLTRLTRNAVVCEAFPAKRFISRPWGKTPGPFSF